MEIKKGITKGQKNWYAIYVNSRAEKKVCDTLLLKGIEAYVPIIKTMKQWSDRKKMVDMPLINGYVFINIATGEEDKVLKTKSVVGFLREYGRPAIVREEEINRLKQWIELGYQIEAFSRRNTYNKGDKVKIISGVFKNIEGHVVENKKGRYIEVYLESIGQGIRIKLPEELLIEIE